MDQKGNVTVAPPPSYPATAPPPYLPQQTEGVYRECIPYNMPGSAQLAYIDIQPRCLDPGNFENKTPPVFEPFSNLIQAANHWLRHHPSMAVSKCETTERRLQKLPHLPAFEVPAGQVPASVAQAVTYQEFQGHQGQTQSQGHKMQNLTYDIDTMLKHETQQGSQSYIKGLRVWLRDKSGDGTPQHIGMLDTVPDEETLEIPRVNATDDFVMLGEKVISFVSKVMDYKHHITFKGLEATVEKLNKSMEKQPIPGDIINLELVTFRRQFETSVHRDLNPNETACLINMDKVSRKTKILRLFYIAGKESRDPIGLQALVPQVTRIPKAGMMGKPQFQKESQLYSGLAAWLGQNQDITIKSIIQAPVRYYYKHDLEQVFVASDSMDEVSEAGRERYVLNTRLIFYTRSSSPHVPVTCLTSRVFQPMRLGLRTYENMGQTMERINAWLRVTGLPVFHMETMEMLFTENDRQGVNAEKTDYNVRPSFGLYYIVAYKLYFTSLFKEPDPITQPPTIDWMTQGNPSMSCHIL